MKANREWKDKSAKQAVLKDETSLITLISPIYATGILNELAIWNKNEW